MSRPPAYEVRWTAPAAGDLQSILRFIAEDRPSAAFGVLKRIRESASSLERSPGRGREVPELREQGIALYRELIVRPWRILYRVAGRIVFVFAVVDSRRRIEDALLDRLTRRP